MSLRSLRTLTVIARKNSFAAAAEHLHLTQAAVSLQVKKLEEELETELFERAGRSPRLNADGRLVVERAKKILALYDGLKDELTTQGEARGLLTLGAVHTILTGPLPSVLAQLQRDHEELKVKLCCKLSAQLAREVEDGELDAALITEPLNAPAASYDWQEYDTEPFFVIAPKGTEATGDESLFTQFPFIRFDKNAWAGAMVDRQLLIRGICPQDVMEFDSLEATLSLVEQGLGIAVVPLSKKRHQLALQKFSLVPFGSPQLKRRVGLYQKKHHPRRFLTALVFDELCRKHNS